MPGSRHVFMQCYDPADAKIRIYMDGGLTPLSESDAIPLALFPRLDDDDSRFSVGPVSAGLRVYRAFACPTADPSVCR